jgi:hypothetical protein
MDSDSPGWPWPGPPPYTSAVFPVSGLGVAKELPHVLWDQSYVARPEGSLPGGCCENRELKLEN